MKIIITMAGLGSRFSKIGINKPKYKIIAKDKSLFEWSMLSLKDFFDNEFIFITRKEVLDEEYIHSICNKLGIKDTKIISIDYNTDGQATTAYLANEYIDLNESCIIYNIDTYVKPFSIKKYDIKNNYDGFIPVITAEGDRWSFVKVNEFNIVTEVAEKKPISNLATIGFYYFKKWYVYKEIYEENKDIIKQNNKEVYVAPMYQNIIDSNGIIGIKVLNNKDVNILGTPEEIHEFDQDYLKNNI